MFLQALEEESDGSNITAIKFLTGPATAGEHPSNSTPAVDDSRARVSRFGECARFKSARQHGPRPRKFTRPDLEGFAKDRTDVVETSDREPGSGATLEDHDGRVAPVVDVLGAGVTHLGVGNGAVELEKAVRGVLERRFVGMVRVYPVGKGPDGDLGPKVNSVSNEVGGVDFGGIDLDDRKVLSETVLPGTENERGGKNDMTNNTFLRVLPVSFDDGEELLEPWDRSLRLV